MPLVLVFAWAFEMTLDGIKNEKDVDRSQSITSHKQETDHHHSGPDGGSDRLPFV